MEMTPRLRPLSVGDLLDAAFRIYRKQFLTLIGITALLMVPMAIIQAGGQALLSDALLRIVSFSGTPTITPGGSPFDAIPFTELILFYAFLIVTGILYGVVINTMLGCALTNAVARHYLGEPVTMLGAYRLGAGPYLSGMAAAIVLGVAMTIALGVIGGGCMVVAVVVIGAISAGGQSSAAAGIIAVVIGVGIVLLLLPVGLFFYTRFQLAIQAIVLENCGPIAALRRSWKLVGHSFWRSLLILFLLGVLAYLVSTLPASIVSFVATFVSGGNPRGVVISTTLSSLTAYLGLILVLPIQFAVQTLLFYDLRVRFEGYDLELQAQRVITGQQ